MNDLTAKDARNIAESPNKNELECVLTEIKVRAQHNQALLIRYKPLKNQTIIHLQKRGFKVGEGFDLAGSYYSISW